MKEIICSQMSSLQISSNSCQDSGQKNGDRTLQNSVGHDAPGVEIKRNKEILQYYS